MKSTYQALAFLLLLITASPTLAQKKKTATSATETTAATASTATASAASSSSDDTSAKAADTSDTTASTAASGSCISITFTSSDSNFNYLFNGGWGSGSGKLGSLGTKSLCGSGAMFVGTQTTSNGLGAASGGNTKLECSVGSGGSNVCDVSVCDGFSLAMHCTGFGSGDIGGTQNLFNLGTCPKKNPTGPTCVNENSHTSSSAAFFKNGGKYWYDDNKFVGTTFTGNPKVTCAVSKGSGGAKMVRRHAHGGRAHARGLVQLLGS